LRVSAKIKPQAGGVPIEGVPNYIIGNGSTFFTINLVLIPGIVVVHDGIIRLAGQMVSVDMNNDLIPDIVGYMKIEPLLFLWILWTMKTITPVSILVRMSWIFLRNSGFEQLIGLMVENKDKAELYVNNGYGIMSLWYTLEVPSFRDAELNDINCDGFSDLIYAQFNRIFLQ